jgi:hypothetical protein
VRLSKQLKSVHHSCMILSSFKIMIIFNNTSPEIKPKSADVLLNMITIFEELRIVQLCSKNEKTLEQSSVSVHRNFLVFIPSFIVSDHPRAKVFHDQLLSQNICLNQGFL